MNQINHSQFAHLQTPRHERALPAGSQPLIRPAVTASDLPAPAATAIVGSPGSECAQIPPAVREMKRVLDAPPALAPSVLRGDTWLTRRWRHGPLHAALPPMPGHVVVTYYAHPHDIAWRSGGQRLSGRTRPGTVTLIPEGRDGRWDIEGPIEVSHVYVSHERLQASADPLTDGKTVELLTRAGHKDPTAARILELLAREAETMDASTRLFSEQAIDLLATQLVRAHSSLGTLKPPEPRRGLADWQARRVIQHMRDNLGESIGLDELAELVGLSRFHFLTSFRLATGKTPHDWLVAERIERARTLLANPAASVTEVALGVGYGTPSAFAASFRRVAGMTPTEFRRRL